MIAATFLERPNRFIAMCRVGTETVRAHVPDPGRLVELMVPGRRIWLRDHRGEARATEWSTAFIELPDGRLVSLDTQLPNRLVRDALTARALPELRGWKLERTEWKHGKSRIDFLLARGARRLALEVKSVTLCEDGLGLFPDAVSARAARHLGELAALARTPGWRAAVLFVCQRDDVRRLRAARHIDPVFADALVDARRAGVSLFARRCVVSLAGLGLGEPLPVDAS